jgi:hypothetical protein
VTQAEYMRAMKSYAQCVAAINDWVKKEPLWESRPHTINVPISPHYSVREPLYQDYEGRLYGEPIELSEGGAIPPSPETWLRARVRDMLWRGGSHVDRISLRPIATSCAVADERPTGADSLRRGDDRCDNAASSWLIHLKAQQRLVNAAESAALDRVQIREVAWAPKRRWYNCWR